mmetsp:Transcript_9536/g.21699  ORF Transcript_9536/g.21699 Transcript_9536/m.21699 type:complete len:455 (+) Transcript_9536:427-1791(+)
MRLEHAPQASSPAIPSSGSELVRLRVLCARLDLTLQERRQGLEALLLVLVELSQGQHLHDTALAEDHLGREVGQVRDGGGDVRALRALPAGETREDRLAQPRARIGHGECRAALATLGVDDIGARVLHMLVEVGDLVCLDGLGHLVLGEEREDRLAGVAANDWHVDEVGVLAGDFAHELVRTDDVEGGDADNLGWIQALLLVELSHGRHHGVHGVHDEGDNRLRAELGARADEALRDVRVRLEEIVARHAGLPRHARRDEHEVAAGEALLEVLLGVATHLHDIALASALALEVAEVGCHARGRHRGDREIADAELLDVGVHAHEEGERLANASRTAEDADLECTSGPGLLRLGLGLRLHLGLGLGLWLRLLLGLLCGLALGLGLRLRLRLRLRLALALLLHGLALLPVCLDRRLLVLLGLPVSVELLPQVGDAVLGVDPLLCRHYVQSTSKGYL